MEEKDNEKVLENSNVEIEKKEKKEEETIIDTGRKEKNGENRCPQCGASDVTYNTKKKKLVCNYCFTEFEAEKLEGIVESAKNLEGEIRTTGTKDIDNTVEDIITLKCGGCGAEVVINTKEETNARCHWCRSILSINSQIENGAIPDVVLPFNLEKKEAQSKINEFVSKRQFFAHPVFKKEFTTNNIMGVFFPYMMVDAKLHAKLEGEGEHLVRKYRVEIGDNKEETRYDADLYEVGREFDIAIDDLTIESSSERLNKSSKEKTNNVINAILPFDTENCVKYKGNYLVGYTSEKRDVNISHIEEKVDKELKDVTRYAINKELKFYDRGVRWDKEDYDIRGKQWVSSYLPVWLYSYQDQKKVLHYVAVNGRNGKVMGSIPLNKTKLIMVSLFIEIICLLLAFFINQTSKSSDSVILYILFSIVPIIYYGVKLSKYRNKSARHVYEQNTKNEISNLKSFDELLKHEKNLRNSTMKNANNKKLEGEYIKVELKKE